MPVADFFLGVLRHYFVFEISTTDSKCLSKSTYLENYPSSIPSCDKSFTFGINEEFDSSLLTWFVNFPLLVQFLIDSEQLLSYGSIRGSSEKTKFCYFLFRVIITAKFRVKKFCSQNSMQATLFYTTSFQKNLLIHIQFRG